MPTSGRQGPARDRVLGLLKEAPERTESRDGYIDLLGERPSGAPTLGQRAMTSRGLPTIYEAVWRPIGVRLAFGALGIGGALENDTTEELLDLDHGDVVLDVACGPGNTTRRLLGWVGEPGLVVGLDASPTMLARAVKDTSATNAAYVRADAEQLPFRDDSFDAVSCYAALYLIGDPFSAIDEMVRVLSPGGRLAVLTSCHRGPAPLRPLAALVTAPGGIRMFARDEITAAFRARGLEDVRQRVTGLAQFVGGRKSSPGS